METIYVLWGTQKGSKEWAEEVITETKSEEHLEKAKKWAKENEYYNIRVMKTYDGEKPKF